MGQLKSITKGHQQWWEGQRENSSSWSKYERDGTQDEQEKCIFFIIYFNITVRKRLISRRSLGGSNAHRSGNLPLITPEQEEEREVVVVFP